MSKSTYSEDLKDPRWQKKRLKIFERDDFTCTRCYAKNKTLHVHHEYYVSGRKPWDYPDDSLNTLCENCHEEVTNHERLSSETGNFNRWELLAGLELDEHRLYDWTRLSNVVLEIKALHESWGIPLRNGSASRLIADELRDRYLEKPTIEYPEPATTG